MAIAITSDLNEVTRCSQLHLLPCEIEHNGSAQVSQYFDSSVRESSDENSQGHLTASFRGRPLMGEKIEVPRSYKGLVLQEYRTQDDEERKMVVTSTFDEFTYWNLDQVPSEDNSIKQALLWLDMANVLHKPMGDHDSQKSLTGK